MAPVTSTTKSTTKSTMLNNVIIKGDNEMLENEEVIKDDYILDSTDILNYFVFEDYETFKDENGQLIKILINGKYIGGESKFKVCININDYDEKYLKMCEQHEGKFSIGHKNKIYTIETLIYTKYEIIKNSTFVTNFGKTVSSLQSGTYFKERLNNKYPELMPCVVYLSLVGAIGSIL